MTYTTDEDEGKARQGKTAWPWWQVVLRLYGALGLAYSKRSARPPPTSPYQNVKVWKGQQATCQCTGRQATSDASKRLSRAQDKALNFNYKYNICSNLFQIPKKPTSIYRAQNVNKKSKLNPIENDTRTQVYYRNARATKPGHDTLRTRLTHEHRPARGRQTDARGHFHDRPTIACPHQHGQTKTSRAHPTRGPIAASVRCWRRLLRAAGIPISTLLCSSLPSGRSSNLSALCRAPRRGSACSLLPQMCPTKQERCRQVQARARCGMRRLPRAAQRVEICQPNKRGHRHAAPIPNPPSPARRGRRTIFPAMLPPSPRRSPRRREERTRDFTAVDLALLGAQLLLLAALAARRRLDIAAVGVVAELVRGGHHRRGLAALAAASRSRPRGSWSPCPAPPTWRARRS